MIPNDDKWQPSQYTRYLNDNTRMHVWREAVAHGGFAEPERWRWQVVYQGLGNGIDGTGAPTAEEAEKRAEDAYEHLRAIGDIQRRGREDT